MVAITFLRCLLSRGEIPAPAVIYPCGTRPPMLWVCQRLICEFLWVGWNEMFAERLREEKTQQQQGFVGLR